MPLKSTLKGALKPGQAVPMVWVRRNPDGSMSWVPSVSLGDHQVPHASLPPRKGARRAENGREYCLAHDSDIHKCTICKLSTCICACGRRTDKCSCPKMSWEEKSQLKRARLAASEAA